MQFKMNPFKDCLEMNSNTAMLPSINEYLVNKLPQATGMSEDNAQGWKIVRKIDSWPRSEALRTVKFWG